MKNAKTLTEGPLAKQILLVSLPLALSNLLQVLFNMSDVAVVGRFAGSTALGAVGSTSIFVTLFTGFLIGLSNGINVLVARFYGAKHPGRCQKDRPFGTHHQLYCGCAFCCLSACWGRLRCWNCSTPSRTCCPVPFCTCACTFWVCPPWRCITSATRCSVPLVTRKSRWSTCPSPVC